MRSVTRSQLAMCYIYIYFNFSSNYTKLHFLVSLMDANKTQRFTFRQYPTRYFLTEVGITNFVAI